MDATDTRQQSQIDGLERREWLLTICAVIGAVGSVFQVLEAVTIWWRLK